MIFPGSPSRPQLPPAGRDEARPATAPDGGSVHPPADPPSPPSPTAGLVSALRVAIGNHRREHGRTVPKEGGQG